MKYSIAATVLAASSVAFAGPVITERQAAAAITDIQILNYALTLEHLEDTFYRQGLANYTEQMFVDAGFPAPFYSNLKEIASDEKIHVSFLTTALGSAAVAECKYSFPSTDVRGFVALASVVEGVGVSAYLGAGASIMNKDYLTAAGSILTVEARHSAYIRASLKEAPFPQPFDVPLTFNEVYTLAAPFIVSCPTTNAALPVKAFPTLTLSTSGTITTGSTITLLTPGYKFVSGGGPIYGAFITITGPISCIATPVAGGFTVVVPAGVKGQSYVVLSGCDKFINDDTVVAGPAIVEIY